VIIGVTGHQNIPESAVGAIRSEIKNVISRYLPNVIGLSSLAAGADQLFAQVVLMLGGSLHVVIPSAHYESAFTTPLALAQFERLLDMADSTESLPYPVPSEPAFLHAGRLVVDRCDLLIAVWDGRQARGPGGTADVVQYAREVRRETIVVWPQGVER
jgi:hypothetical protein